MELMPIIIQAVVVEVLVMYPEYLVMEEQAALEFVF
jgi:hypothetical protein